MTVYRILEVVVLQSNRKSAYFFTVIDNYIKIRAANDQSK